MCFPVSLGGLQAIFDFSQDGLVSPQDGGVGGWGVGGGWFGCCRVGPVLIPGEPIACWRLLCPTILHPPKEPAREVPRTECEEAELVHQGERTVPSERQRTGKLAQLERP